MSFSPWSIKHTLLIPYVKFNIAPAKLLSNGKVFFQASIFQGRAVKLPVRVGDRWSLFWIGYVAMSHSTVRTTKICEKNGITSNEVSIQNNPHAYAWKNKCWTLSLFVETFQDEEFDVFFRNSMLLATYLMLLQCLKLKIIVGLELAWRKTRPVWCSTPLQFGQTIATKELTTLPQKTVW